MKNVLFLIILFVSKQSLSQSVYLNQNDVEISKKEFRKLKRKGRDSLMAISSYDQQFNELFLKRKPAKITNAKEEITAINQITGNKFDTDQPLLVLYYPYIEEATLVRDEILQSKHWYTSQYSIILRNIQENLGNVLIVAAPNFDEINLPGIYNDELQYFHLTYFNSTVETSSFLWISEENSFIEPIDFIQNYAVVNTKQYVGVSKSVDFDSLTSVDKNLQKIDTATFTKSISKIEYVNLSNEALLKVIHEDYRVRKIDTVWRNEYADYFTELTGKKIKRNDTIILDFHLYTYDYENFFSENLKRELLQDKVNEHDSIKLVWMAQAGSLYVPEGCVYDIKDVVRKKLAFEGPTEGDHFIVYPDGTLLISKKEHSENINLKRLKNGTWGISNTRPNKKTSSAFLIKKEIAPPKVFKSTK